MPTLTELAGKTKTAQELWMTTRRSSGDEATFPLWFVHDGERLYVLAAESSSEVGAVQDDDEVSVAIGEAGSPDRLEMTAEVMTDHNWVPMMIELLQKKYNGERMERTAEAAKSGPVIIKLKPLSP